MTLISKFKEFDRGEKKKAILKLFDSIEWQESGFCGPTKTITSDHFDSIGLYVSAGPGEDDSNYKYVASIIRAMGHSVMVGMGVYVYKDGLKRKRERKNFKVQPMEYKPVALIKFVDHKWETGNETK